LSFRAFLLRLRKLAVKALARYGLEGAKLKFIYYSGNGLYQVRVQPTSKVNDRFTPGKYTLRLHQPDYMRPEHISSELDWLSALHESGIGVPEPFRNLEGNWLSVVESDYDIPRSRNCTLLRWIDGRLLKKTIRPHHFKALGRVTGRMQNQARGWKIPRAFSRRHWDWEGLFGDGAEYGVPARDVHAAIPQEHKNAFNETLNRIQEASEQLGKRKNVYGLIHADLGVDSNVLFRAGEAIPIDFDDCGFGYWIFDLGVILAHYISDWNDISPKMRNALIEGYLETSTLSELNLEYLDLFIAARFAQLMYFYHGAGMLHPPHREEARREVDTYGKELKRILKVMR